MRILQIPKDLLAGKRGETFSVMFKHPFEHDLPGELVLCKSPTMVPAKNDDETRTWEISFHFERNGNRSPQCTYTFQEFPDADIDTLLLYIQ